MKKLKLLIIVLNLIIGCTPAPDMKKIYFENQPVFKKIEYPIKLTKKYTFEPSTIYFNHSEFDSLYLISLKEVFNETDCNLASIKDGDVLIGVKKSLHKLLFTNKSPEELIYLKYFTGSLEYLLRNGKTRTTPYLINIAPNWYVVEEQQLL